MSIRGEIDRISDNIALSYSAVEEKGGTLPDEQNSASLPDAIRGIPTGALLESLTITALPTKLSYYRGEYFDPSGMEVQAVYTNGAAKEVSDYTVDTGWANNMFGSFGTCTVRLSYTEFGITRTDEFDVSVTLYIVIPTDPDGPDEPLP